MQHKIIAGKDKTALIIQTEFWRKAKSIMNDNESGFDLERTKSNSSLNLENKINHGEKTEYAVAPNHIAAPVQTSVHVNQQIISAHAKLIVERGKNIGKEFILRENEVNIGRWDADNGIFPDVDLDAEDADTKISRRHAKIRRSGGEYTVEDLGSTNGTFINRGRRLIPGNRQILHDGDEIIVGKTFLRFQIIC